MTESSSDPSQPKHAIKRLGFLETVRNILARDGVGAFWRGIGPALVLVINPVLQYTAFEQLKNKLVVRRTAKLRAAGFPTAVAVLSDWDFFLLGAISKLRRWHSVLTSLIDTQAFFSCHVGHVPLHVGMHSFTHSPLMCHFQRCEKSVASRKRDCSKIQVLAGWSAHYPQGGGHRGFVQGCRQ
jgi:hypothetical protein